MNATPDYPSRLPFRFALILAAIVFPLIWVGGLVTTYDAGMAVPDWPNTYNYNMFAYPVRDWFFGPWDLFVEHGHRLLGSLAGIVAIGLVIVTFRNEPRRWVRWSSAALLGLVIFQGLLGGARVLLDDRSIARIHGCVGPFFFAAVVGFGVVTSRWWWARATEVDRATAWKIPRLAWLAIALLLISYAQLVVGAFLRHIDVTAPPSLYSGLIVAHIVTAIVIAAGTLVQWASTRGALFRGRGVQGSIRILMLLVAAQICLGLGTWVVKYGWPAWMDQFPFAARFVVPEKTFWQMNLVTAHVAVGSLILAFWTIHALRCLRDAQASPARLRTTRKQAARESEAFPIPAGSA